MWNNFWLLTQFAGALGRLWLPAESGEWVLPRAAWCPPWLCCCSCSYWSGEWVSASSCLVPAFIMLLFLFLLVFTFFFLSGNCLQNLRILSPRCNGAAIILFRRRGFFFSLVAPGHLHSSLSAGPGTPPRKKVSTGIYRPPKLLTK